MEQYNSTILKNKLKELELKLDTFEDGRINYTNSNEAVVILIIIKVKEEFLVLKRGEGVDYPNLWSTVGGYVDEIIDENCILEKIILNELDEELGFNDSNLINQKIKILEFENIVDKNNPKKNWITYFSLLDLEEKPKIKLNKENKDFKWLTLNEIKLLEPKTPFLVLSIDRALSLK